jgi:hypothetical protein
MKQGQKIFDPFNGQTTLALSLTIKISGHATAWVVGRRIEGQFEVRHHAIMSERASCTVRLTGSLQAKFAN